MQPMYLDTNEADDKSHGNSWSRQADELFVREEGEGDEGGGDDHMMNISGTDNVSVCGRALMNTFTVIFSLYTTQDSDQQFSGL